MIQCVCIGCCESWTFSLFSYIGDTTSTNGTGGTGSSYYLVAVPLPQAIVSQTCAQKRPLNILSYAACDLIERK